MEPTIVEKGQIILVGFSFYGDPFAESGGWTEENEIGRLWRRFEAFMIGNAGRIKHVKDSLVGYEIHIWSEETATKGHADVFAGIEVEKLEDVPMEILVKILPPTTYAVWIHAAAELLNSPSPKRGKPRPKLAPICVAAAACGSCSP